MSRSADPTDSRPYARPARRDLFWRAAWIVALAGVVGLAGCASVEDDGDTYAKRADWERAESSYAEALAGADEEDRARVQTKLDQLRSRAFHQLMVDARSALAGRRLQAAEALARRAGGFDPGPEQQRLSADIAELQRVAAAHVRAGEVAEREDDWIAADDAYAEALAVWTDMPGIADSRAAIRGRLVYDRKRAEGRQALAAGEFEDALAAFEEAQRARDTDAIRREVRNARRQIAKEAFDRALAYGITAAAAGDHLAAVGHFEEAVSLAPHAGISPAAARTRLSRSVGLHAVSEIRRLRAEGAAATEAQDWGRAVAAYDEAQAVAEAAGAALPDAGLLIEVQVERAHARRQRALVRYTQSRRAAETATRSGDHRAALAALRDAVRWGHEAGVDTDVEVAQADALETRLVAEAQYASLVRQGLAARRAQDWDVALARFRAAVAIANAHEIDAADATAARDASLAARDAARAAVAYTRHLADGRSAERVESWDDAHLAYLEAIKLAPQAGVDPAVAVAAAAHVFPRTAVGLATAALDHLQREIASAERIAAEERLPGSWVALLELYSAALTEAARAGVDVAGLREQAASHRIAAWRSVTANYAALFPAADATAPGLAPPAGDPAPDGQGSWRARWEARGTAMALLTRLRSLAVSQPATSQAAAYLRRADEVESLAALVEHARNGEPYMALRASHSARDLAAAAGIPPMLPDAALGEVERDLFELADALQRDAQQAGEVAERALLLRQVHHIGRTARIYTAPGPLWRGARARADEIESGLIDRFVDTSQLSVRPQPARPDAVGAHGVLHVLRAVDSLALSWVGTTSAIAVTDLATGVQVFHATAAEARQPVDNAAGNTAARFRVVLALPPGRFRVTLPDAIAGVAMSVTMAGG